MPRRLQNVVEGPDVPRRAIDGCRHHCLRGGRTIGVHKINWTLAFWPVFCVVGPCRWQCPSTLMETWRETKPPKHGAGTRRRRRRRVEAHATKVLIPAKMKKKLDIFSSKKSPIFNAHTDRRKNIENPEPGGDSREKCHVFLVAPFVGFCTPCSKPCNLKNLEKPLFFQ